jgi:hypothetical protein
MSIYSIDDIRANPAAAHSNIRYGVRGVENDPSPISLSSRWVYPELEEEPIPNRFEINVEPRYLERTYPNFLQGIHDNPNIGCQSEFSNTEYVYEAPTNSGEYDEEMAYPHTRSLPRSPVTPNQRITGYKRTLRLSNLPRFWIDKLFQTLYSKNKKTIRNFLKRYVISAPYTDTFTPEIDKRLRDELLVRFKLITTSQSLNVIENIFYDGWYTHINDRDDGYYESDGVEYVINHFDNLFLDTDAINIDIKRNVTYNKKNKVIKPSNKAETLRNRNHNPVVSPSHNKGASQRRRRTQRLQAIKLRKKQELFDAEEYDNAPNYDGGSRKRRKHYISN